MKYIPNAGNETPLCNIVASRGRRERERRGRRRNVVLEKLQMESNEGNGRKMKENAAIKRWNARRRKRE